MSRAGSVLFMLVVMAAGAAPADQTLDPPPSAAEGSGQAEAAEIVPPLPEPPPAIPEEEAEAGTEPSVEPSGPSEGGSAPTGDHPSVPTPASPPTVREGPAFRSRPPLLETPAGLLFDLGLELLTETRFIRPLELTGNDADQVFYGWMRGRADIRAGWKDRVGLSMRLDLLDEVVLGDNGLEYGSPPFPNEGLATTARSPNLSRVGVVVREGGDPLDSHDWVAGLVGAEPLALRQLWGEVDVVAGVVRAGRMPSGEGRGILINDGQNGRNRFGPDGRGDTADRLLFGTKPIELVRALLAGSPQSADRSPTRGLTCGAAWDFLVNDRAQYAGDDAHQIGLLCAFRQPEFDLAGVPGHGLRAAATYAYRWSKEIELSLNLMQFELEAGLERFRLEVQAGVLAGHTREVSDAISLFRSAGRGSRPTVQTVRSWGMFAIAEYSLGPVDLAIEFDYATGDGDPRSDTRLTQFAFSRDTRVGLLLFPHLLAYESSRSAAAAAAFIRQAEAPASVATYANPASEIETGGAFTNAIALFPQVTWRLLPSVFVRAGVLVAWADEPVIDPYESLRAYDADDLSDDLVNYNGGRPGSFYGTEFDLRLSAGLWDDRFRFDLEGALFLPGDALSDQNGFSSVSGLVQGRLTFAY